MTFSAATKLTAVIGHPIKHSLSPLLHNAIYEKEGVDAVMLAFENPSIAELVAAIRALPIHLTAVTLPHKQSVIPLLDEVDPKAAAIGSVNTIVQRDGKLIGFNTDVIGIGMALKGADLKGKNTLLLGAGGAANAVSYHLKQEGANIFNCDRTLEKAQALCKKFGGTALTMGDFGGASYEVIINATPVGMFPNIDESPISADTIQSGATIFDLIYTPLETRLMREARAKGATAISGLSMLIAQGLEQERLWLGRDIADTGYTALLEAELRKRQTH